MRRSQLVALAVRRTNEDECWHDWYKITKMQKNAATNKSFAPALRLSFAFRSVISETGACTTRNEYIAAVLSWFSIGWRKLRWGLKHNLSSHNFFLGNQWRYHYLCSVGWSRDSCYFHRKDCVLKRSCHWTPSTPNENSLYRLQHRIMYCNDDRRLMLQLPNMA